MPTSHSLVPIDTQTTPILRLLPDYLIHCQSTNQYIRSPPLPGVDGHTGYSHSQITLTYYSYYAHSQTTPFLKLLPDYFMHCQSTNQYTKPIQLPGVDGHTGYSHSRSTFNYSQATPILRLSQTT